MYHLRKAGVKSVPVFYWTEETGDSTETVIFLLVPTVNGSDRK